MTHLFWQYSQNTIIYSECKHLFSRVEGGDAHWRLYRLPVVTEGAEPLLGPGSKIRRYTPVYQCPNDGAGYLRGQWRLQAAVLLKFWGFVVNTIQAVLADQLESSGMSTGFGKLSTTKNTPTNLRSHQIYIKMPKYCKFIIFIF